MKTFNLDSFTDFGSLHPLPSAAEERLNENQAAIHRPSEDHKQEGSMGSHRYPWEREKE